MTWKIIVLPGMLIPILLDSLYQFFHNLHQQGYTTLMPRISTSTLITMKAMKIRVVRTIKTLSTTLNLTSSVVGRPLDESKYLISSLEYELRMLEKMKERASKEKVMPKNSTF
jgi:hypothetical protein